MFPQAILLGKKVRHKKINFLSRYPEVRNIATSKTGKKRKKGIIIQGIRLQHCINRCQAEQLFSLPRQIKPVEEVALTKF